MRSLKLALLATAATAVLSSAAFAADLVVDQPSAPPVINNAFNWDGAYIGAFLQGQSAPAAFGLGVDLGVNALMNDLVIGGDLEAVASTGPNFSSQLTGKIGGAISDFGDPLRLLRSRYPYRHQLLRSGWCRRRIRRRREHRAQGGSPVQLRPRHLGREFGGHQGRSELALLDRFPVRRVRASQRAPHCGALSLFGGPISL